MPKPSPFDQFLESDDTPIADSKPVPNKLPTVKGMPYRLAIIGEAPGKDEAYQGEPFVGMSGRFLTSLLSRAGIVRDACLIANIVQHRPPNNEIDSFAKEGKEFAYGLEKLAGDLHAFDPHVCLLLGKTALFSALGTPKIGDWRGSMFIGTHPPFVGRKCIASYHPAACLRQYDFTSQLMFDIKKARAQAEKPDLTLPNRQLRLPESANECLDWISSAELMRDPIAIDIEGYVDAMKCISIAPSSTEGFIVPFTKLNGDSYWDSLDDEVRIWKGLSGILCNPDVPKILQNSLYDRFVLQYSYGIVVRGVVDDTMLKSWEMYCEFEKSLGFLCSIYTDEPYYKFERKADNIETFFHYCIKDSCVTHEISGKIEKLLGTSERRHYNFNLSLLNALLYMENRGIRYDVERAKERLAEVNSHVWILQAKLDDLAGFGLKTTATAQEALDQIASICCYKRSPGTFRKEYEPIGDELLAIARRWPDVSPSERGRLNTELGLSINIKSKDFKILLYETLECPKQYHPITGELTTNYEALLKIKRKLDQQ